MEKQTIPFKSDYNDIKSPPSVIVAESSTSVPFRSTFASLSLHMTDRIRLINFPPETQGLVQTTISTHWPGGIQHVEDYHGSLEFKLRGNPWRGAQDEAIHARRFMCRLLAALFDSGWVLSLCTDISKKQLDKDTLIFRLQDPIPQPCDWFCIAFSNSDRLRLIDAPQNVITSVKQMLEPVLQNSASHRVAGVHEYKIKGLPWVANGGATVEVRKLLLGLLMRLEAEGFTVYASVDQKTGPGGDSHRTETDTWHCSRPQGWATGLPVYHA